MAEIKIRDLSVGDWVRYDIGTDAVQIMGIYVRNNQECVVMSDSYFPDGVIGFVERIKPIPLTPEILEKNGFEELKDKSWVGHNHHCHIQQHGSSWTLLSNKRGFYRTIRFENLAFVHELQNALRLAGVEKEIEV